MVAIGHEAQALSQVLYAESLAGQEVLVAAGTLEAEEAVGNVLHHIQSDRLVRGLQSSGHVHRVIQQRVQRRCLCVDSSGQ